MNLSTRSYPKLKASKRPDYFWWVLKVTEVIMMLALAVFLNAIVLLWVLAALEEQDLKQAAGKASSSYGAPAHTGKALKQNSK